jgi:hypothetical protein
MTIRIDHEHININEGGHWLTFYWRWAGRNGFRMFRLWARPFGPTRHKRTYELRILRGNCHFGRVRLGEPLQ